VIEFDVETTGLQWAQGSELFLAQFLREGEPVLCRHPDEAPVIQYGLDSEKDGYRAWNSKFDLHFLKAAGYELPPEARWHDGMVAAHIVDERYSVALQNKGNKMFGEEAAGAATEEALLTFLTRERAIRRADAKQEGIPYIEPDYSDVPWDIMAPYAAHDVVLQRELCDVIMPAIDRNPDFKSLYAMEMEVLPALFWAEDRGIPFDRQRLIDLEADLMPKLDEARELCVRISEFRNFNPASPKQVSEALDRLGADVRLMTRSGDTKLLKTDAENLHACPHPLADAILDYRGLHKLFAWVHRILHGKPEDGKFPEPYLTTNDRVHPDFRQVGARTGRMSGANPNFQNLHRDDLRPRYCVRATPGMKLVSVDLDQIELRLLAAFAGDGALRKVFKTGGDPHQMTADLIGLRDYKRPLGGVETARQRGKRWNYLKNYGGGQGATRKFLQMSKDEYRAAAARYEEAFPDVRRLEDRIEIALLDKGYIKTPWGRRHRIYRNAEREAYTFIAKLLQGTAADLFKDAARRVHQQGVPLIGFVHDELLAEVPEGDAEEAGRIMVDALIDHPVIAEKVPLEAEAKIVDSWSDTKKPGWTPAHERSA